MNIRNLLSSGRPPTYKTKVIPANFKNWTDNYDVTDKLLINLARSVLTRISNFSPSALTALSYGQYSKA